MTRVDIDILAGTMEEAGPEPEITHDLLVDIVLYAGGTDTGPAS